MTVTPWGDSNALRERSLPPGPGTPREEVARNQRERLYGAMVAVASEKGYAQTSVADLLAVSGVSRRAFYQHFESKLACFLATVEEILGGAAAATASRLEREGPWEERARRSLDTFLRLLAAQPAAARLCLVEAHTAGPEATALVDRGVAAFEALLAEAFEQRPDYAGVPAEMVRAMAGGMRKIVHTRLHRGLEAELAGLAPELMAIGLSYRPPPRPLRARRGRPREEASRGEGASGPERLSGIEPGERIVRATLAVVAERGYQATTIGEIATAAGVSLSTFYERFDGKADALDAALYSVRARMLGYALPLHRRARSWPEAIRAATEASLDFLAAEPEFARLIAIDVYAAGPEALERRDRAIEAAQRVLDEGVERYAPQMKPIWREGIISSLYAMLCARIVAGEDLPSMAPIATYTALCPFLGPQDACEIANGGGRLGPPRRR